MDAATILSKIFDPVAEEKHLNLQRNKDEAIHKENQQIQEQIAKLEQENDELTKRLLALKADSNKVEFHKLQYLYETKQKLLAKNNADFSFNTNRAVTGYAFVHETWNNDPKVQLITCYYNENCYVRIVISSNGLKDLIEVVPNHPNFLNIRKFLLINGDVAGLLAHMLQYFKLMEKKQEISTTDEE